MTRVYAIFVWSPPAQAWYEVCVADSEVSAASVVRSLLAAGEGGPQQIRIDSRVSLSTLNVQ